MGSSPSKQKSQFAVSNRLCNQQEAAANPQQAPARCGLCKTGITITSKCLQCDLLLCENCRHQHLKEETNQDHRVNYIEDIGKKFEVLSVKKFTTGLPSLGRLLRDQGNKFCISCYSAGVLYQIQMQDQDVTTINTINMGVYDMARLSQNKILLSIRESRLKLVDTETGEINDSVYDVSPFWSLGFRITKDNNIIIGCGHKTEDSERYKVMILDKNGTRLTVYEHDQHNQPIFTFPVSLTITSNGYIHVADYDPNNDRGRVIVLDRDGRIITRYTGHPDIKRDHIFSPTSIVTTPADRVIITDLHSHALHILDNTGQLVAFINTIDKGIILPYSLAFMDDGHLLIICFGVKTAEFLKVKISDV